jgi:hypothetical protein
MSDAIDQAKEQAAVRKERERIVEMLVEADLCPPEMQPCGDGCYECWLEYLTPEGDSQ